MPPRVTDPPGSIRTEFDMASQHSMISGKVVDTSRKAISDARVFFSAGPGYFPDIAALTNQKGEFSLPAPVEGLYTVEVAADGFRQKKIVVNISGELTSGLSVELEPEDF